MDVAVYFRTLKARKDFEAMWIARTGGTPIDKIRNGVQFVGHDAERAADLANEIAGVRIVNL